MPISRRRLMAAAVAVPGAILLQRAIGVVEGGLAGAARAARPEPSGTSATRCAQCGSPDHTMLDPDCPLAPRVLG